MFKTGSCAAELSAAMAKNMVSNQIENKYGFAKLSKAIDYLNSAAKLFENAGMNAEAEMVVNFLQSLAQEVVCQCKSPDCIHNTLNGRCANKTSGKKVIGVGDVCDTCAAKLTMQPLESL